MEDEDTIESLKEKLKQVTTEYENYAYITSHDLKAPLRAINNLTHWIEDDFGKNMPVEISGNFTLLKSRVDKMNKMIEALTVFSRVGTHNIEKSEIDFIGLLNDLKEELELDFKKLRITIEADPVHIHSYREKLKYLIYEIIKNAASHNKDEEIEVLLKASRMEESMLVIITDNGKGVKLEPDQLNNLYNLFFTLEPQDKSNTVGAGLTVCKKIIQFVNGEISIENTTPTGLKVTINWPNN